MREFNKLPFLLLIKYEHCDRLCCAVQCIFKWTKYWQRDIMNRLLTMRYIKRKKEKRGLILSNLYHKRNFSVFSQHLQSVLNTNLEGVSISLVWVELFILAFHIPSRHFKSGFLIGIGSFCNNISPILVHNNSIGLFHSKHYLSGLMGFPSLILIIV